MAAQTPGPQREIRRRNLSRVLYAVAQQGPSSRAAVATRLGLTRTAVSTLVDELLRGGLLTEQGPAPAAGGPGRPGTALALPDSGPCGLGAEIGVDHLAVCAIDLRGRVRARAEADSPGRDSVPDAVLTPLRELVDQVAARARELGLAPAALAVAVPGLVTRGTATVVRAPNLGWHGVDLTPPLAEAGAERDPLPLLVDNEANLGALAELWLSGGRVPRDFVHVSAEVGIGAAVVLDGALLRGHRGFAGEMGHMPVHPDGERCACGGRGCLEQYAGEPALLRAAGIPADGPRAAALAALRQSAASGCVRALDALGTAGGALGLALAGTVNLLDPRALVLGGVLARFAPWLLPSLERELRERTAAPGALPELLVSELGADGPLLGAAHTAVRVVLDDPLAYPAGRRG
ncbi:ROK family transcriptional regulator [Streptomyces qinglanensis]|uniref:Sugar kinase of the NBD/HSP70 family, may contain an N-terminal HTH domain n=1 Tax=Streptomyces qinglanensis TaxID=943816 RepID=A0A1H9U004_9ACTN|nr:ROK family transcriptional regulator [Streptomyces qinglanensis]SES02795.1 Sugar kinase of the NBD/HSP70 family, may contain an N-terminal HTH domain [Streptomyces qinglanensis]